MAALLEGPLVNVYNTGLYNEDTVVVAGAAGGPGLKAPPDGGWRKPVPEVGGATRHVAAR